MAGTTLYVPVAAKGALFEAGDGHAGQGNGEVDVEALETYLTGTFRFIVHKDRHLIWPRAETPDAAVISESRSTWTTSMAGALSCAADARKTLIVATRRNIALKESRGGGCRKCHYLSK